MKLMTVSGCRAAKRGAGKVLIALTFGVGHSRILELR